MYQLTELGPCISEHGWIMNLELICLTNMGSKWIENVGKMFGVVIWSKEWKMSWKCTCIQNWAWMNLGEKRRRNVCIHFYWATNTCTRNTITIIWIETKIKDYRLSKRKNPPTKMVYTSKTHKNNVCIQVDICAINVQVNLDKSKQMSEQRSFHAFLKTEFYKVPQSNIKLVFFPFSFYKYCLPTKYICTLYVHRPSWEE